MPERQPTPQQWRAIYALVNKLGSGLIPQIIKGEFTLFVYDKLTLESKGEVEVILSDEQISRLRQLYYDPNILHVQRIGGICEILDTSFDTNGRDDDASRMLQSVLTQLEILDPETIYERNVVIWSRNGEGESFSIVKHLPGADEAQIKEIADIMTSPEISSPIAVEFVWEVLGINSDLRDFVLEVPRVYNHFSYIRSWLVASDVVAQEAFIDRNNKQRATRAIELAAQRNEGKLDARQLIQIAEEKNKAGELVDILSAPFLTDDGSGSRETNSKRLQRIYDELQIDLSREFPITYSWLERDPVKAGNYYMSELLKELGIEAPARGNSLLNRELIMWAREALDNSNLRNSNGKINHQAFASHLGIRPSNVDRILRLIAAEECVERYIRTAIAEIDTSDFVSLALLVDGLVNNESVSIELQRLNMSERVKRRYFFKLIFETINNLSKEG